MQNIPVFDTENGVASLILKEIPYTKIAYILIRSSAAPEALLAECVSFCRVVGAESIYATGDKCLQAYPFHTAVWKMEAEKENLEQTDAVVRPVTDETLQQWLEIYNCRMTGVANAAYLTSADGADMLKRRDGWFVYRGDALLGIGMAAEDTMDAVISVIPGAGKDVVLALKKNLTAKRITLQVASANERAIRLYDRLGFVKTEEISRWYKII